MVYGTDAGRKAFPQVVPKAGAFIFSGNGLGAGTERKELFDGLQGLTT